MRDEGEHSPSFVFSSDRALKERCFLQDPYDSHFGRERSRGLPRYGARVTGVTVPFPGCMRRERIDRSMGRRTSIDVVGAVEGTESGKFPRAPCQCRREPTMSQRVRVSGEGVRGKDGLYLNSVLSGNSQGSRT